MPAPPPASGAVRARIAHSLDSGELVTYEDGLLAFEHGRVTWLGNACDAPRAIQAYDLGPALVVPGFVDTHVHYVQTDMIASFGATLLEWLDRYAFPAEMAFADPAHAREVASFFIDELLRNGTTTALVFGSVHADSVDAVFEAAQAAGMRLAAGKVLMDRHCPEALRDTAQRGYDESKMLAGRWHGHDRLAYAITPRFAPTSSEAQLDAAGALAAERPELLVQSHVAENLDELAWVKQLFPARSSYLDVYAHHGLLRERSVYAHCIHLGEADRALMRETGAATAFCPTSNLFLGSGLLDAAAASAGRIGLGSDVGGGTSLSMLRTAAEAYKVMALQGQVLDAAGALSLLTLRGAEALGMDGEIGNFAVGKEADFVALDPAATPLLARRCRHAESVEELLFALLMLGDDRAIAQTWLQGRECFRR